MLKSFKLLRFPSFFMWPNKRNVTKKPCWQVQPVDVRQCPCPCGDRKYKQRWPQGFTQRHGGICFRRAPPGWAMNKEPTGV